MLWVQMIFSLVGVLGLIFFMFWLLRKVNKQMRTASGSRLRILDRAITGRESSLIVVSVSGKLMLIGVSTGRIEKLCDLEINEDEYFNSPDDTGNGDKPEFIKFSDVLKNALNLNKNKSNHKLTEKVPFGEGEEKVVEPDNKA